MISLFVFEVNRKLKFNSEKRMIEINTNQGRIKGDVVNLSKELNNQKVLKFSNVPFAKAERFEKPRPYGNWEEEVYDGTQIQTSVPQTNMMHGMFNMCSDVHPTTESGLEILMKELKIVETTLHLSVYTPENLGKYWSILFRLYVS